MAPEELRPWDAPQEHRPWLLRSTDPEGAPEEHRPWLVKSQSSRRAPTLLLRSKLDPEEHRPWLLRSQNRKRFFFALLAEYFAYFLQRVPIVAAQLPTTWIKVAFLDSYRLF